MFFKPLFIFGILIALSISSYAGDSITIRYLDNSPIGVSSEQSTLKISKTSAMPRISLKQNQEIDTFFDQVLVILHSNKINKNWQFAIPDAPAIEITIELNNRKVQLISCHIFPEKNK